MAHLSLVQTVCAESDRGESKNCLMDGGVLPMWTHGRAHRFYTAILSRESAPVRKEVLVVTVIAIIVIFGVPGGSTTTLKGGEWNSFILNSQNTRYQAASTINSTNMASLKLGWYFPTQGSVTSTPIVLNGNVYFNDWNGTTYSVNLVTGQLNWKIQLTKGYWISTTPLYTNGLLYISGGVVGSKNVHPWVFAVNPSNGNVKWSTELKSGMQTLFGSPTFFNGLIYIGAGGCGGEGTNSSCRGGMFALNANTGSPVWNFTTGGTDGGASVWGSVVFDPNLNAIYFGTGYNYLISTPETYPTIVNGTVKSLGTFGFAYSLLSLNAATGAFNWYYNEYPNKVPAGDVDFGSTPNLFSLTINGTTHKAIGEPSKDGNYYVLDRVTGKLLAKDNVYPATSGGGMIGLAGFTSLTAGSPQVFIPAYYGINTTTGCCGIFADLQVSTGTFLWMDGQPGSSVKIPGKVIGSVALAPGIVVFGDDMGNLFFLSSTNGAVLRQVTLPSGINGGVTIAEGHVVVGVSKCVPLCQFQTGQGVYAYDVLPTPTLSLAATPSTVTFGLQGAAASVTLSGGKSPTGSLTFRLYSSSSCSSTSQVYSSPPVTVNGAGTYQSGSFSPPTTGTYYWTAVYSGDANNNPGTTSCNAAASTVTVSSIPKVTSFGFSNSPTSSDPTLRSGTLVFTFTVQNFGASAVTLAGSLSVTGTATLACTGGNTLTLSGSVAAGSTATFTLTCTYSGSTGESVNAMLSTTFTDVNGVQGTVSESPASLQYSL
jgi:polyvinyl alcohol dehydrogenase (cytochrome)